MSWKAIGDLHREKYGRDFIVCDESQEHDYFINLIRNHFPRLSRQSVEAAVNSCCLSLPHPCSMQAFIECLKSQLPKQGWTLAQY